MEALLWKVGDAREDIGEPRLWVEIVKPGGGDERVDEGGSLAAAVGTGK